MVLLFILLFVIPVAVYPENILGYFKNEYMVKNYLLIFVCIYLSFFLAGKFYLSQRIGIKNTDKLCGLYLLFSFISWLINGKYFNSETMLSVFIYALIFVSVSHKKYYLNENKIVLIWFLSLYFTGIFGLYQWFLNQEVASTLGNRNFYGGFIVCGTPFILYSLIKKTKEHGFLSRSVIFDIILVCLSLFNLYQTRSRAAWIILTAILLLFLIWLRKRIINLLLLSLFIFPLIIVLLKPCILYSLRNELNNDVRPYIWSGTLSLISANPILGVGPGNYFIEYPKYRPHEYFLQAKATDITRDAHNEWLQVFAETGSLGFICLAGILFFIGYRLLLLAKDKRLDTFLLIMAISVSSIVLHNMVDVNMRYTTMAVIFWTQLGIMASAVEKDNYITGGFSIRWSKIPVYVLLIVFSAYLTWNFVVKSFFAETYFQSGINSKNENDWNRAVAYYEKALRYQPYNLSLMYYAGFAYDSFGKTDSAIETYKKIAVLAPYYAYVRKNLATCYLKLHDYNNALSQYSVHLLLNPYDPDCYLNMSYCYYKLANTRMADQMRAQAVELYQMIARNLMNAGNYFKAKSYLETAYKVRPDDRSIVLMLGECYSQLNDLRAQQNIYADYLKNNPANGQIRKKLERITGGNGN